MSIYMARDTQEALGEDALNCSSRSLAMERLANPLAKDESRHKFFERAIAREVLAAKRDTWVKFLTGKEGLQLPTANLLFAQLQSRLMLNMAGGVMENAGLGLDRFTGVPCIPGSAVKGCTRRMAIQLLRQAEAPEEESKETKAQVLCNIARVFGWAEHDWKGGRRKGVLVSDFEFACGESWPNVRQAATEQLAAYLQLRLKSDQPLWQQLPNFGGTASFLPAYPVHYNAPGLFLPEPRDGEDLQLDVLTCHHQAYYGQKLDRDKNAVMPVALDTEDPKPVVFPAVAAGVVFVFGLQALPHGSPPLLALARSWLRDGLATFGLGAKTAAGYGWFKEVPPPPAPLSPAALVLVDAFSRRKVSQSDFRAVRPKLKALPVTEVPRVLTAIFPENELSRVHRRSQFWQSFTDTFQPTSDGSAILKAAGLFPTK